MLQVFITADVLITNGSTLSWWSAILGQKEIYTNRKNLLVIYKWLKGQ
jgi:predicted glycosyltransferase